MACHCLQGDSLHHMVSGSTLIVFVTRGPLLLVAASRLGEPIMALQRQLELLYRQVLLVVTTGARWLPVDLTQHLECGALAGMVSGTCSEQQDAECCCTQSCNLCDSKPTCL